MNSLGRRCTPLMSIGIGRRLGSMWRLVTLLPIAFVSMAFLCPGEPDEPPIEDEVLGLCYSYAEHRYISEETMTQAQCDAQCPTGACEVIQQ